MSIPIVNTLNSTVSDAPMVFVLNKKSERNAHLTAVLDYTVMMIKLAELSLLLEPLATQLPQTHAEI